MDVTDSKEIKKKRKKQPPEKLKQNKKKRSTEADSNDHPERGTSSDTTQGTSRHYTVSIALPGSIVNNAQCLQLKTYLVGQIARAAAIFNVDEIVVFDECGPSETIKHDPNSFMCKILQYLDTPQYLRKSLIPMHPDLKFAGLLNPLDAPHHMRMDEETSFREGIILDLPARSLPARSLPAGSLPAGSLPAGSLPAGRRGSYANCGTQKKVLVDRVLEPGVRVTIKMDNSTKLFGKHMLGSTVPPSAPRVTSGTYWGYSVRMADSFSSVFTDSPYKGGYDITIGTSERGRNFDTLKSIPTFRHLLIVFGGLRGLEYSLEGDESLMVNDVSLLFNYYLNTCPKQGSRTIRTEEAVLITLSSLRPLIEESGSKDKDGFQ